MKQLCCELTKSQFFISENSFFSIIFIPIKSLFWQKIPIFSYILNLNNLSFLSDFPKSGWNAWGDQNTTDRVIIKKIRHSWFECILLSFILFYLKYTEESLFFYYNNSFVLLPSNWLYPVQSRSKKIIIILKWIIMKFHNYVEDVKKVYINLQFSL